MQSIFICFLCPFYAFSGRSPRADRLCRAARTQMVVVNNVRSSFCVFWLDAQIPYISSTTRSRSVFAVAVHRTVKHTVQVLTAQNGRVMKYMVSALLQAYRIKKNCKYWLHRKHLASHYHSCHLSWLDEKENILP